MMGLGAPQRLLNVRLWSPGLAPRNASASLAPPAGLRLGRQLDLDLYRPEPGQVEPGGAGETVPMEEFTIKIYWGSSEQVREGQPRVIRWTDLTPEQKAAMRDAERQAAKAESYFYKPEWTTGYWPTGKQPGAIAPDAKLAGSYALTSSYTGNVTLDVPQSIDFLASIDLTRPSLKQALPLAEPIRLAWRAIPGVLGYHAMVIGMQEKNTLILWYASEVPDAIGARFDYLEMAQVRAFVERKVLMEGSRTAVTVPAGIFQDADMAFLTMVGYGPGAALAAAQPLPRLQTKTTLSLLLGGKQMPNMGDENP